MAGTGVGSAVTGSRARRGIFRFRPAPGKPGRLQFIDVMRGWAVLIMIETHVLNGMLMPELKETALFKVLNFVNGLVAPAFLFASGLAFAVATRRKLADYLALRPPFFRQLARLGLLFVIGYGLHIPKFDYYHLRYETGQAAWEAFYQVDVLQCIAASLLILQLLLLVLRTERRLYLAVASLLTGIILATPLVWQVDFQAFLPLPLAEYFTGIHRSLFPLFPWAAFVLAGALAGYYYLETSARSAAQTAAPPPPALHQRAEPDPGRLTRTDPRSPAAARPGVTPGTAGTAVGTAGALAPATGMIRFSVFALALIAVSFMLEPLASRLYPVYDYWKTSPSFVLVRVGMVMLCCAGFYFYERRRPFAPTSLLAMSGRESLLIYTVHLMILYGNFAGPHFVDRVGFSYGFAQVFGVSAILIALMILLAWLWNAVKAGPLWFTRTVEAAVVAGFAYVFFVGL